MNTVAKVKYLTDSKGNKSDIVIPFAEWNRLNKEIEETRKKLQLLTGIQSALVEAQSSIKKKKNLKSLKSFLNEN